MKFEISQAIPRAALVTGGTRQLAIAQALIGAGFAVALQCHPDAAIDHPAGITVLPADLGVESQTASLLEDARAAVGPIGVLVNGAGTVARDTWDDANRATWDINLESNLRAPFVLMQGFARILDPSHEGVAINMLDQRLCPHLVSWTLAKAALWSLTQTMALALAPQIRVNGILHPATEREPLPGAGNPRAGNAHDLTSGHQADRAAGSAALAILAFASMTGQMIVPGGMTPPAVKPGPGS